MRKIIFYITAFMFLSFFFFLFIKKERKKEKQVLSVIAYYSGNSEAIDKYPVEKLTHIIYSFCHLKGNKLNVDNKKDSATIKKLVSLKKNNSTLKVLLSLGGWGGCEFCSPVFSTEKGRNEFAWSVKELNDYFKTDGIDLDWEYPAIEGHPGHAYHAADKLNFTELVKAIRKNMGSKQEISFAAGGFPKFLEQSINWPEVMPLVNNVNLMSYDLVGGYSTKTGHHTPLYSNATQKESADDAIRYLLSIGVRADKIVIGSAFYARTWENVANINNGLYQSGKFKSFIAYDQFNKRLSEADGFIFYRDSVANAPYAYNAATKTFATFDDPVSIKNKTQYAIDKGLRGIMFWELTLDKQSGGLLHVIDQVKKDKMIF
ncbi:MAG: glycoside hydrolase family 18 protein [Chitinophagaceae bacterium]